MAHLKTKATSGNLENRQLWKWTLVRGLFEKGYTRDDIVGLFRAIDRMMALPPQLQQKFKQEVNRYQEERKMLFLSRIEEEAIEQGIQIGIQQERQRYLQAMRDKVREILEIRFSELPQELNQILNKINELSILIRLMQQAFTVSSLSEFQQLPFGNLDGLKSDSIAVISFSEFQQLISEKGERLKSDREKNPYFS